MDDVSPAQQGKGNCIKNGKHTNKIWQILDED